MQSGVTDATLVYLAGHACTRTGRAGAGHRRHGGDERVPSDRLLDVGSNLSGCNKIYHKNCIKTYFQYCMNSYLNLKEY